MRPKECFLKAKKDRDEAAVRNCRLDLGAPIQIGFLEPLAFGAFAARLSEHATTSFPLVENTDFNVSLLHSSACHVRFCTDVGGYCDKIKSYDSRTDDKSAGAGQILLRFSLLR